MTDDGSLSPGIGLPIVAALLLANAIFVAAEFALVTVRRTRIDHLASEGSRSARQVQAALGNLDYYIAAAQLGITMASILLGFFGEPVLAALIEPPIEAVVGSFAPALSHTFAIAVAFLFITSLHIVVGEFVPKTIALEQPERASLGIAVPLGVFVRIFGPVIGVLNAISFGLFRLFGMDLRPLSDDVLTSEDLAFTFESSASAGLISRRELTLTRHLLHLADIECSELMVPRGQIIALEEAQPWEEILDVFDAHPLTRYPVYRGSIDTITGILDAKRLLLSPDGEAPQPWQAHLQDPVALPETVSAEDALGAMRRRSRTMVILVDEYGGTAGLITQFDIVKYLAADLPDEVEVGERHLPEDEPPYPREVSGLLPLTEFRELAGVELAGIDASTVGGLVTELRRDIPAVGDSVAVAGLRLTVVELDQYRVARVRITPDADRVEAGAATARQEGNR